MIQISIKETSMLLLTLFLSFFITNSIRQYKSKRSSALKRRNIHLQVSVIYVHKGNKIYETYICKKGLNEGEFIGNWEGYWI
jgi:hypothetical protein